MVTDEQRSADRKAWTHGGDPLTVDCSACQQPAGKGCTDDFGDGAPRPAEPHLARTIRLLTVRLIYLYDLIIAGRAADDPQQQDHPPVRSNAA